MSLDLLMTLAQGTMTLFLLPTVLAMEGYVKRVKNVISGGTNVSVGLRRRAGVFVPRATSLVNAAGLAVIALVLVKSGLPIGGSIAALCGVLWMFIFVFRGTAPKEAAQLLEQNEIPLEDLLQREGD